MRRLFVWVLYRGGPRGIELPLLGIREMSWHVDGGRQNRRQQTKGLLRLGT